MKTTELNKFIRVVVEETEKSIEDLKKSTKDEMWMSTNEAGLTSEKKELLKGIIKKYIEEILDEEK